MLANTAGAALGGALLLLVILALVAVWVWALVDAIRVPRDSGYRAGTKLLWVLVIASPACSAPRSTWRWVDPPKIQHPVPR